MAEERSLQVTPGAHGMSVSARPERLTTRMGQIEIHPEWPLLSRLPMRLTAGMKLPRFKVKDLLALGIGSVVETMSTSASDVPLHCGDVQLGWAEFEVMEQRLAVRITRID
jgi:flagellar motor switch protein FliN/FliY